MNRWYEMKRKAISPLIATILLVVVAVALIAIVLTWGKTFTQDSLAETTDIIDSSCSGAHLNVSNCKVGTDGNITFYVKNIGTTYTFPLTDEFMIDITTDDSKDSTNLNLTNYATWAGLGPGQMVQVDMDLSNLDGKDISSGTFFDVTVRSSVCPTDAVATAKNCHR